MGLCEKGFEDMKLIENIFEPKKVMLVWQANDNKFQRATGARFIVGEIINSDNGTSLHYYNNGDTNKAKELGFNGLTTYPYKESHTYNGDISAALSKRLPPTTRPDYKDFLRSFRISPESATHSSPLALLAYTRGEIAGDGFSFYPALDNMDLPFQITFEIAGFRYNGLKHFKNPTVLKNENVKLELDQDNMHDEQAVKIMLDERVLGYVPKGMRAFIGSLIPTHIQIASIEKVNGTAERPRILVFLEVRKS